MKLKKRKPIHAGDTVEHIKKSSSYGELMYGTYTVIATDVKTRINGKWVESCVYASDTKGIGRTWYVMEKQEFINTFKLTYEELEEEEDGTK